MPLRPAFLLVAFLLAGPLLAQPNPITANGPMLGGLERLDATMTALMEKYACPGAQLAVTQHGRLVLSRGYGFADRDIGAPVRPDSRFRIASLSKLITAAAVLTLVEQGKLNLDAPAFALLPDLSPVGDAKPDPRLARITVRHLLQHTGGWNRDVSGDAMFNPIVIATTTGTAAPAGSTAIIRYIAGRPLDFDPGTKYAYSNLGYNILGRIIEKITGQSYGDYVQTTLLARVGIKGMMLGRSLAMDRLPGEVTYYTFAGAPLSRSVFPSQPGMVPSPYGGFHLEAMDAHGAWIANATDFVRLLAALDGSRPPALLNRASLDQLTARPAAPVSVDTSAYYGLGVNVRPIKGATGTGANWWHGGSLPGTITYQVRLASGWSWAAFFNSRPQDNRTMPSDVDRSINAALAASHPPATGDLFDEAIAVKK